MTMHFRSYSLFRLHPNRCAMTTRQTRSLIVFFFLFQIPLSSQSTDLIKGADVSWLQEVEAGGGVFREGGSVKDPLTVLRKNGVNTIRLRVWHTPAGGVNGLEKTLAMALRASSSGFALLIDLHYSDTWADPVHQAVPAAWKGITFAAMKDSIRSYTAMVMSSLKKQGTPPAMVQLGNEIICGMLWNDGYVCGSSSTATQWTTLGELLQSARNGVSDVYGPSDNVQIMIHIDAGGNLAAGTWFFDNLTAHFTAFDVIGLSYYPWWQGEMAAMQHTVEGLAERYQRDVVLAETAYPFTLSANDDTTNIVGSNGQLLSGYPATMEGQKKFLTDVITVMRNVPGKRGRGIFYWEPDAISAPGWSSPWENLALFGFDGEGLPALKAFGESTALSVRPSVTVPDHALLKVYPNPFNPTAVVEFTVPVTGTVIISIYNSVGQQAGTLFHEGVVRGEVHTVRWNGTPLSSGVYCVVMRWTGGQQVVRTMLVR